MRVKPAMHCGAFEMRIEIVLASLLRVTQVRFIEKQNILREHRIGHWTLLSVVPTTLMYLNCSDVWKLCLIIT